MNIREHHDATTWQSCDVIAPFKVELGFEQIAKALGVPRPSRTG